MSYSPNLYFYKTEQLPQLITLMRKLVPNGRIMKNRFLIFVFSLIGYGSYAQIGIGTLQPDKSSALEIKFTDKGVLLSRVALKSIDDITTIANPTHSLILYNTATTLDVTPGYYYWNETTGKWVRLLDAVAPTDGWRLSGNSGTVAGEHFIGTTDDTDVVFKRNTIQAGLLTHNTFNTSYGVNSYKGTMAGSYAGRWNTAIGYNSLHGNSQGLVVGHDNVALGANSLSNNYNGAGNTALGSAALKGNTNGSNNTASGHEALVTNSTGNNNVANGAYSLNRNNGDENAAVGTSSMSSNESGSYNAVIGSRAMQTNTKGNNNTAMGFEVMHKNKDGNNNTAVGYQSMLINTIGSGNTAIGYQSGPTVYNLTNTIAIGNEATVQSSNTIQLGNSAITTIAGQVPFTITSDRRYKEAITPLPLGLDFINRLQPVEYIRKNNSSQTKEWGIIAQDLVQTLQDIHYKNAGIVAENSAVDHMLSVRYNDLIAPVINSIQELAKSNEQLQKSNNAQKERIDQLESDLSLIKNWIEQLKKDQ